MRIMILLTWEQLKTYCYPPSPNRCRLCYFSYFFQSDPIILYTNNIVETNTKNNNNNFQRYILGHEAQTKCRPINCNRSKLLQLDQVSLVYIPYLGLIVTIKKYSKDVAVKGFCVWTQVFMTEPRYPCVSVLCLFSLFL